MSRASTFLTARASREAPRPESEVSDLGSLAGSCARIQRRRAESAANPRKGQTARPSRKPHPAECPTRAVRLLSIQASRQRQWRCLFPEDTQRRNLRSSERRSCRITLPCRQPGLYILRSVPHPSSCMDIARPGAPVSHLCESGDRAPKQHGERHGRHKLCIVICCHGSWVRLTTRVFKQSRKFFPDHERRTHRP